MDAEQRIIELERRIGELERRFDFHRHDGIDTQRFYGDSLEGAPFTFIADPSGGMTVDSAARTAINEILDILEQTRIMYDQ